MQLGVRQLRANLAALLRRAQAGQRIVITVGGRAVAQLGPVEAVPSSSVSLAELAAAGLVLAPRRDDRPAPGLLVALPVGTRIDRLVAEVR
ncbi:MAG: type II toxin-antitoxin system Phd/YefM family antitoxin [Acidimicrobiales bacterium]